MNLSEDQGIVEQLKDILKKYDYLAYDEEYSRNRDLLRVKVKGTRLDAERDSNDIWNIHRALEKATGQQFYQPSIVGGDKGWIGFNLRRK